MNNPFEYSPDEACDAAFAALLADIEELRGSTRPEDVAFCRVLDEGVMLGVLIAEDSGGKCHTLRAFSGQLGAAGFHYPGFVEPVFDYLQPDGYFKTHEAEISLQNAAISQYESETIGRVKSEYQAARAQVEAELEAFRVQCRASKQSRDARRRSGRASDAELADMIRRSQFEKAELHRLKKRAAMALGPFEARLKDAEARLRAMKEKRRADSEALQSWLFGNFKMFNARGESASLSDIFAGTPMGVPPSGAGECCAPKLLHAAYRQGLKPVSIAEYWYGKPRGGKVRVHGRHYPACRGRCLPVLGWMLQGLSVEPPLDAGCRIAAAGSPEIVFENQWFCVVEKPAGMLSVPGRTTADSVQRWLQERYGENMLVKVAHRLDQDTSGLLVATFGDEAFKTMQSIFATRRVSKTYVAVLDGDYTAQGVPSSGRIELPLSPDPLDRPRQCIDFENGKEAVTEYKFIAASDGHSRIEFHPLTGRTHQLRMHSASSLGLGMPITGDRLYGTSSSRLHLHATRLEFTFPLDGRHYSFDSPVPF
ncbi:MAG: RNA pseudouridine synthase [Muribaculaceae bacterium]|nr:RNA pseudouridine synthase [Muribaculaceae bacterium]